MTVVISYSRDDREVVARLRAALAALGEGTWMDQDVVGGTAWWESVLGQVRQAFVLVFALSDAAWWSEVCRRELDYAERLGIPVVFVRVGSDVARLFEGRDLIDYTGGADVRALLGARITRAAERTVRLPDPLPAPPELPFAILYRLSGALGPEPVTPDEQDHLVALLRRERLGSLAGTARAEAMRLLRDRPELTFRTARALDEIIRDLPARPDAEPRRRGGVFVSYRRGRAPATSPAGSPTG